MKVKKTVHIDIKKTIEQVKNIQAKVGFFSSARYEDGTPVATVAIWNEYGSPKQKRPPRPFMRPAMNNKEAWKSIFVKASKQAWQDGNFQRPFELVAMTVQGDIKENISSLTAPALSATTLAIRKQNGNNSSKPLIDTKYMLTSVTYEVTNG